MADELAVRIVAHDDASATLRKIQGEVTGLHGSMTQMGVVAGAVGGIVATSLTSALGGLSAALSGAGGSVIGMSSKLEQAGIAFETMLGSAEKAQAFLSDLQDFAAKTPFEFPELVDASKRMLAFGFAAENVRPVLTAVGNAAAAMGSGAEGINRITTALGQMKAKGMVQAEEILQLTEAGIPAWDMLAKKLGVDVVQAMDAVTKRTVTADTFLQAFTEGSAARFGDMMERQSHTFAGAMSTIKDTIGQLIGGAFQPFYVQISQFADQLAQGLGTEAFQTWVSNIQEVLSRLGPLFGQFMAQLQALGPVIQQFINNNIQGFVAGVQSMGERVLAFLPTLGEFAGAVAGRVADSLGRFISTVTSIGEVLSGLAGPAGAATQALVTINDALTGHLTGALERFQGPAQAVLDWLGQLAGALGDVPGRVFTDLGEVLTKAAEGLGRFSDLWAGLIATLGSGGGAADSIGGISDAVHGLLDALEAFGAVAADIWLQFQAVAIDAYNAIQPALAGLRTWLSEHIPPALAAIRESWDGFWSHAGPLLDAFWGAAQPILTQLAALMGSALVLGLQALKRTWDDVWTGITAAMERVQPILSAVASVIGGWAAELADSLTVALNAMRDKPAEAAEEGATAVRQAFIQGTPPVVAAVTTMATEASAALTPVATSATRAASAMATLGPAATSATPGVAGLGHAGKEAASAFEALAKAMGEAGKSTDEATVARSQAFAASVKQLDDALKSLNPQQQAQITAMKNAGEVTAALTLALDLQRQTMRDLHPDVAAVGNDFTVLGNKAQAAADAVLLAAGRAAQGAQSFRQVGGYITDGIRSGLNDFSSRELFERINGVMRQGVNDLKAQWGIRSPSSVMAEEVGRPIAEGIGEGFTQAMPGVTSQIAGAMGGLVSQMTDWGRRAAGAFDASLVFSGGRDSTPINTAGSPAANEAYQTLASRFSQYLPFSSFGIGPESNQIDKLKASQAHMAALQSYWESTYGTSDPTKANQAYQRSLPAGVQQSIIYQDLLNKSASSLFNSLLSKTPLAMQAQYQQMAQGSPEALMRALQAFWQGGGGSQHALSDLLNNVQNPAGYNPLLGASANAVLAQGTAGAGGGGGTVAQAGVSGSGFAQAPLSFAVNFGTTGDQLVRGQGGLQDLAFSVQQSNAAMQAWAKTLQSSTATIAQVAGAFSAIPLDLNAKLVSSITGSFTQAVFGGPTGPLSAGPGSSAFVPSGNTPGGANFGALQTLAAQITAEHPNLSADAQARLIQQGMRTNQEYLRVVGNLSDTSDDLRREQADAINQVNNWTNVVGMGIPAAQELADAQARLTEITNQLAATVTAPVTVAPPPTAPPTPVPTISQLANLQPGQFYVLNTAGELVVATAQTVGAGLSHFAAGGLVTRPTTAMVGERGPEAIIPLNNPRTALQALNNINQQLGAATYSPLAVLSSLNQSLGAARYTALGTLNTLNAQRGVPQYTALNTLNTLNQQRGLPTYPTRAPSGPTTLVANITIHNAATTPQMAAQLVRQMREEFRRQGTDVSRIGGF